jgi:hypothetical protein
MAAMFVTSAVLNNGTDCNDEQPENILFMAVTNAVLNNGTDCNDEQPVNIRFMAVTDAVLNNGTDCNSRQPRNMCAIVVVLCETTVACSKKLSNTVCVPAESNPPNLNVVAFGADTATSNHPGTVDVDDLAE